MFIPDKGFQNKARLYQAVIAPSVEPSHIFVSINGEGSNPTRLLFFVKEIFFLNIILT